MKKTADSELKRSLKLVRNTVRPLTSEQLGEVHGASSLPVGTRGGCSFTRGTTEI